MARKINPIAFITQKYNLSPKLGSVISLPDTRSGLAKLFQELGYKVGAEIGVERGFYSKEMCEANPGVKLYCIDPWKVYRKWGELNNQHYLNANYNNTIKRLAPYNCEIIRRSSEGAVVGFEPNTLDFIYIDGNHNYDYVLRDLGGWAKIIKTGGIVSGHDYRWRPHQGRARDDVERAIIKHFELSGPKTLFLLSAQGSSSWFYVK